MATVKIRDLPYITSLQPNTANTVLVGVDVPGDYTGQMTLTTLASGLYSHNHLVVGDYDDVYPNAVATFAGTSNNYVQTIIENIADDGTTDFVAQANVSTDTAHFIDVGFTGDTYNNISPYNSLGTSIKQLDGYLYVQGLEGSKGGNLVIGTASSNTLINFIVGGVNAENVVAHMTTSGIYSPSINSLVAANVSSLNASITANAASANAVINSRISSNIATANLFTQAAFDKANSALANTTGTFAGNLTVTGNVITQYALRVNNASIPGNTQYVVVTGTATGAIGTPSNPGYTFHSAVDGGNRVVNESYSNNSSDYASFIGRRARGTAASPTAVQNGDTIVRFGGNSYGTTKFSQFSDARIEFVATENHSDSAKGTKIRFMNTADGTNTATEIATFNANTVTFTGSVVPAKGFVYTPRVLTGAQTAITIDFSTDSIIRATFNSTLTMTLSNYVYGKIVDVWVTNTAGNGQTINLGALANNVTTGSATLSVAAGRSAKLQYFSIDGDQANTFLAVTYA